MKFALNVKLPCPIGTKIRTATDKSDSIRLWDVVGFDCNEVGAWSVKLRRYKDRFHDCYEYKKVLFANIGKTAWIEHLPADWQDEDTGKENDE